MLLIFIFKDNASNDSLDDDLKLVFSKKEMRENILYYEMEIIQLKSKISQMNQSNKSNKNKSAI